MSAAMQSIVTIGRISSHNNHHNRRRLTLTETGFELDGTHFERIESPVDAETNAVVIRAPGQRVGTGEPDTRSLDACVGDTMDQRVSTVGEVDGGAERTQQMEKENIKSAVINS